MANPNYFFNPAPFPVPNDRVCSIVPVSICDDVLGMEVAAPTPEPEPPAETRAVSMASVPKKKGK